MLSIILVVVSKSHNYVFPIGALRSVQAAALVMDSTVAY
jgi:hypothetical protein